MTTKARMPGERGYLETAVGSLVGGVLGAVVGYILGVIYVETFMPYAGLEGLMPPLLGALAGITLGMGLGVWGGLRLRGHGGAGITGSLAGFLGAVVAVVVLWTIEVALDDFTGRNVSQWLAPACAAAAAVLTAVGVRAAVARFREPDRDEPLRAT